MATLSEVEAKTKTYADARAALADRVDMLQREMEAVKRRRLPAIKAALAKTAEAEAALRALIEENAALFRKPRTVIFHGVKVGFQKGKGSLVWESQDDVVRLIFKHFPERADDLTRTTIAPNKTALAELPASDLKRIGVTVEETGDAVVVKAVDGEVEKVVNALLKDAVEGEEAA